jgi:hypothetical protein
MKIKILLLLIVIVGLSVFESTAQTLIKEEDVPENVRFTFERRYKRAEKVKWFKVDKRNFIVKYESADGEAEVHIDRDGVISLTKTKVDETQIPSRALDYLRENHRRLRVHKVYFIERGRRDRFYQVFLHESQGRKKPPKVYEVQFDNSGRYITTFYPEYEPEEEELEPTEFAEEIDEDLDELQEVEEELDVSIKEIPSKASIYLKENFDYEYSDKICRIINHEEHGRVYYIVMKKQGEKVSYAHYFDLKGNLIEKFTE